MCGMRNFRPSRIYSKVWDALNTSSVERNSAKLLSHSAERARFLKTVLARISDLGKKTGRKGSVREPKKTE